MDISALCITALPLVALQFPAQRCTLGVRVAELLVREGSWSGTRNALEQNFIQWQIANLTYIVKVKINSK